MPTRGLDWFARDAGVVEQSSKLDVLDMVMHHARDTLGQREVCTLLCCSKPTANLTAKHFKGQLQLVFKPQSVHHAERFARWLVVNSDLLQSVESFGMHSDLTALQSAFSTNWLDRTRVENAYPNYEDQKKLRQVSLEGADAYLAGSLLAQGFAAARACKLQHLRSFVCHDSDIMVGALMQRLPASLTHLELTYSAESNRWSPAGPGDNGACLAQGLACMTALKSLKLKQPDFFPKVDVQTPPTLFSPLTSLTSLQLCGMLLTPEHCEAFPESLVRLDCDTLSDVHPWCKLGHLTGLTRLDTDRQWYANHSGTDVLPPNLEVVSDKVAAPSVLGPLKSLRVLDTWMRVDDMVELAGLRLPALTSVIFTHDVTDDDDLMQAADDNGGDVGQHAGDGALRAAIDALDRAGGIRLVRRLELEQLGDGVWVAPRMQHLTALTALEELSVEHIPICAEGVQCLSSLTGLTSLLLGEATLDMEALLRLPAALASLPCLTVLVLPNQMFGSSGALLSLKGASQQERAAFYQGLVSLQRLRCLRMGQLHDAALQLEAANALAAATQLTGLFWDWGISSDVCLFLGHEQNFGDCLSM